jgi:hypothetical protein
VLNKDWLYKIIILALFLLLLFIQFCDRTIEPVETETIIKIERDSVYIPGKSDTVFFEKQVPYIVEVPVYKYIDRVDSITKDTTRIYKTPVEDSLISGTIITELDRNSCTIGNQLLSYTPKFPKYIFQTDTVKISQETTILRNKLKIFAGLELGGSLNQFNFGPKISLLSKSDLLYSYNYDLINRTHNISFVYKIVNPFKNKKLW